MSQPVDVYLVIRQTDETSGGQTIRWMNVTRYLKASEDKTSRQIIFTGEKLDMEAVWMVRDDFFRNSRIESDCRPATAFSVLHKIVERLASERVHFPARGKAVRRGKSAAALLFRFAHRPHFRIQQHHDLPRRNRARRGADYGVPAPAFTSSDSSPTQPRLQSAPIEIQIFSATIPPAAA